MADRPVDNGPGPLRALGAVLVLQYLNLGLHAVGFDGYPVVALVLAGIMVAISAIAFMDLRGSLAPARLVAVLAVLYLGLLCLGVAGDVGLR